MTVDNVYVEVLAIRAEGACIAGDGLEAHVVLDVLTLRHDRTSSVLGVAIRLLYATLGVGPQKDVLEDAHIMVPRWQD